ncbi:hypothetical protein M427DRAFT_139549 [Gonapodya prolifera JEL478]|uniref:C2H2-type domain-containing protein n=1 Tax=Gonapodya prolifera (strain JEL478) TaxID=1344416 RepID=A0A139A1I9_GONPJ|nr:hypothetical protein M427DRAFT_139549 [Gonapodya prolifera JEL478]|eukprot:KXS10405.1 hypothetical protein M427DRAFT_139549 [Gonapodya prolifera JEL478]
MDPVPASSVKRSSKERRFLCPGCRKLFTRKDVMNRHRRRTCPARSPARSERSSASREGAYDDLANNSDTPGVTLPGNNGRMSEEDSESEDDDNSSSYFSQEAPHVTHPQSGSEGPFRQSPERSTELTNLPPRMPTLQAFPPSHAQSAPVSSISVNRGTSPRPSYGSAPPFLEPSARPPSPNPVVPYRV